MMEFYPQIRHLHIGMVFLSGALFALRGAAVLAGGRWPHAWPVRWTTYAVDTTLLTAALMLFTMLPWAVFANGWLTTKVVLLVVYIVLGILALRSGRSTVKRAALYVAALLVYAFMISIARAHHPLGIFRRLLE